MSKLGINYNTKCELDTTPTTEEPTWSDMGYIFSNISQSLNEVITQMSYLSDGGWGSSEVTGGQLTVTFTGHRREGDVVSDYLTGKDVQYSFGEARKTKMRITVGAQQIVWAVTLANITCGGGDANQPDALTLTVHGNGRPEFTTVTQ